MRKSVVELRKTIEEERQQRFRTSVMKRHGYVNKMQLSLRDAVFKMDVLGRQCVALEEMVEAQKSPSFRRMFGGK